MRFVTLIIPQNSEVTTLKIFHFLKTRVIPPVSYCFTVYRVFICYPIWSSQPSKPDIIHHFVLSLIWLGEVTTG